MATITKQAPPTGSRSPRKNYQLAGLVDMAMANPGEWYSTEIPDSTRGIYASVKNEVAKRICEVVCENDRVYLRINP